VTRKAAWPIPWTEEDLLCTWLAPERLLLFVQMASPDSKMPVTLKLNGEEFTLHRGYSSIRPNPSCFMGYYADVSSLEVDKTYTIELNVATFDQADFQGLFFDNVETEHTDRIVGETGGS